MVPLAKGQALIGGFYTSSATLESFYQVNDINDIVTIHYLTVIKRNCIISKLDRKISVPRQNFVVIPISDKISGCITVGKIPYS